MAVILKKSCYLNEKGILQNTFYKDSYIFHMFYMYLAVLRKCAQHVRFRNSRWLQVRMAVCYAAVGTDGDLNVLHLSGERKGRGEERDAGETEQTALIHLLLHFLSLGSGCTK